MVIPWNAGSFAITCDIIGDGYAAARRWQHQSRYIVFNADGGLKGEEQQSGFLH